MPGVVEIYHRGNVGALYKPSPDAGAIDEARPPFGDDVVRYYGQYVALVVAETFEEATAAAALVEVDVRRRRRSQRRTRARRGRRARRGEPARRPRGRLRRRPRQNRPHVRNAGRNAQPDRAARVGRDFDGDCFTLYETTQAIVNHRNVVSEILGVPRENVRIVMKFLGSGFGGKLWPWTHGTLAAAAARNLGRPVKLVVTRKQMFQTVGHRARTQQRVRMSALRDGTLTSLRHEVDQRRRHARRIRRKLR